MRFLRRRSPHGNGWRVLLHCVLLGWMLVSVGITAYASGGNALDPVAGPVMLLFTGIGAVASVSAARQAGVDRRTRRAWLSMAAGFLLMVASCVMFATDSHFPSPGDAPRLLAVPFLLLGLLSLTRVPRSRAERVRAGLDIGVVVTGGFMALWYWPLGPLLIMKGVPLPVFLVAVAYPLADLALVFGAAAALLRGATATTRRPLLFAVLGLTTLVLGDMQAAHSNLSRVLAGLDWDVRTSSALQWLTLLTAFCLLACAAVEQRAGTATEHPSADRRTISRLTLLPYAAIAGGYGLLLVVAAGADLYPWGGLIMGTVVMTALVVARQVLMLRENHELIVTDYLTGLATRRALGLDLSRALARTSRTGRLVGVLLIDLDGFKAVNDELGHDAGDELLTGFSGLLRSTVKRTDTVGRLGGDEFAIVLADIVEPDDGVAVALRLLGTMQQPLPVAGGHIVPRASIGIALSRPGDTGREILARADQAMYRAKRGKTGWSLEGSDELERDVRQAVPTVGADGGIDAPVRAP